SGRLSRRSITRGPRHRHGPLWLSATLSDEADGKVPAAATHREACRPKAHDHHRPTRWFGDDASVAGQKLDAQSCRVTARLTEIAYDKFQRVEAGNKS